MGFHVENHATVLRRFVAHYNCHSWDWGIISWLVSLPLNNLTAVRASSVLTIHVFSSKVSGPKMIILVIAAVANQCGTIRYINTWWDIRWKIMLFSCGVLECIYNCQSWDWGIISWLESLPLKNQTAVPASSVVTIHVLSSNVSGPWTSPH